ncbi:MAG: translational GTPase TypA, partial [Rhodospirillales bacterium]|nr:translational GTPase TypA [Rhodospirillales bacterium]
KQLTNMRASGTDEAIRLTPAKRMSLEEAVAYVNDDELLEVTPTNLRLRKKFLDPHERKKSERSKDAG